VSGPLVTVIIPAYNREATIARAVDSVLAQTLDDLELIVVDDASTDRTAGIVAAYADPRVRLLRHARNRRAAAARNTGIRAARGKYVAFLDSDDDWHADKLAVQVADLEAAPPDVRASCTAYEIVRWGVPFPHVPGFVTYRQIFMGCDLAPTALMVRRDAFDTVGLLDESFGRYEDWDWVLRYARVFRMGVLPTVLARLHRGGAPPARPLERDAVRMLDKHAGELAALGARFARNVRALRWFELAEHFYRERDLATGTAYAVKGITTWPFVRAGMYVLLLDALFDVPLQRGLWRLRLRLGGGGEGM
jgi:glycosyltransferase involved in cell wall biosynthesis